VKGLEAVETPLEDMQCIGWALRIKDIVEGKHPSKFSTSIFRLFQKLPSCPFLGGFSGLNMTAGKDPLPGCTETGFVITKLQQGISVIIKEGNSTNRICGMNRPDKRHCVIE